MSDRFETIDDAMRAFGTPLENHDLVREVVRVVGIGRFELKSGYIKAVRREGTPHLMIGPGWIDGFNTEAEASQFGRSAWRSPTRGAAIWGISLPSFRSTSGGPRSNTLREGDLGTCTECFTRFTPSGTCMCDV